MKKKFFFSILIIFFVFCFIVFFKSLNSSNTYIPKLNSGKKILSFSSETLFNNKKINSENLFNENKIYLLNIWASWCVPCRYEHAILMELSKNSSIKIIGLNYKDKKTNAKKFINKYGNPYSEIIMDKDGIIAINLGAYGVPETLIINNNKVILNKFVGPLNKQSVVEIQSYLK